MESIQNMSNGTQDFAPGSYAAKLGGLTPQFLALDDYLEDHDPEPSLENGYCHEELGIARPNDDGEVTDVELKHEPTDEGVSASGNGNNPAPATPPGSPASLADNDLSAALRLPSRKRARTPPRPTYSPRPADPNFAAAPPNARRLVFPNFLARTREPTPPGRPGSSWAHPLPLDDDDDAAESDLPLAKRTATASRSPREEAPVDTPRHTPRAESPSSEDSPEEEEDYLPEGVEIRWAVFRSLRFRPVGGRRYEGAVERREKLAVRCGEWEGVEDANNDVMRKVRGWRGAVERMVEKVGEEGRMEGRLRFENGEVAWVWAERVMVEVGVALWD
ncbi:hypothetical protein OQA88_10449 [Cercophora sp. LCS_1]